MLLHLPFLNDSRVYKEARSLVRGGYDVTLFCLSHEAYAFEDVLDGIKVVRVPLLSSRMKKCLLRSVFKYVEFFWRVFLKVRQIHPHIIHCHDFPTLPMGYFMGLFTQSSLIYDSHELFVGQRYIEKRNPCLRKLLKRTEILFASRGKWILQADSLRTQYFKKSTGLQNVETISNYAEDIGFNKQNLIRKKFGIPEKTVVLLYLGMIHSTGRGIRTILKALDSIENAVFVAIGTLTPSGQNLLFKKERTIDRAFYMEPVPPWEVVRWACGADIGLSLIENESASYRLCVPTKTYEYLMAGIPVIASNFPALSSLIDNNPIGKVGCVIDPYNSDELVQAVKFIISDEERMRKMKENARRLALSYYNWTLGSEKKLLRLYKTLPGA